MNPKLKAKIKRFLVLPDGMKFQKPFERSGARSRSRDQYIVVPEECAASVAHSGTNNWTFKARSYDFLNVLDKLCTPSSSEWGLLWTSECARTRLYVCQCVYVVPKHKKAKALKSGLQVFHIQQSSAKPTNQPRCALECLVSALRYSLGRARILARPGWHAMLPQNTLPNGGHKQVLRRQGFCGVSGRHQLSFITTAGTVSATATDCWKEKKERIHQPLMNSSCPRRAVTDRDRRRRDSRNLWRPASTGSRSPSVRSSITLPNLQILKMCIVFLSIIPIHFKLFFFSHRFITTGFPAPQSSQHPPTPPPRYTHISGLNQCLWALLLPPPMGSAYVERQNTINHFSSFPYEPGPAPLPITECP